VDDQLPRDLASDEGIAMTRIFDASRAEVWREWTEPKRFADWYGGPEAEIPVESVEMDVRRGGKWRATMYAGGREIHWHGEYVEVIEPERLILTLTDQPGDEREIVIVVLRDLGDGRTEMHFEQRGRHLSGRGYEQAKSGWAGFFARMAERLAEV
jgi:uncharacterized protein YndB with AHSA1/START domain